MPVGALMPLVTVPDVTVSVRGAALIGLIVAGGAIGVLLIVLVAWSRRRVASRRAGSASPQREARDPWREAARRVRVDPDDGAPWPPVDPRPSDGAPDP